MPSHAPEPELLERRPEARSIRVEDLLADVRRGRVRVPPFQRGLKWKRDDALSLLDSIYRGYPIGTLLLWQTAAAAAEVRFGSVVVPAPGRVDAWWVVDGQQRIVSLTRVLLVSSPSNDEFALRFDLDERRFTPAAGVSSDDPARWLPLEVVLDSQHLINWLLDHVSSQDRRAQAIVLGKRLREYDIPAYVVSTDNEAALRQIFNRSNSSGKALDAAEVFDALHGAQSADRPATIPEIADGLMSLGFGRVEPKIVFRLLRVLAGADVSDRSGKGGLRLSGDQARAAYASTAQAAREVVQFLKRDVGIPHYDLLPYKQPMVTLGKFFHLHPSPNARSRELLARWLWRGALTGAHRGDTVSTRRALDQIGADGEEASVQRMLEQLAEHPRAEPGMTEPFNFRHAAAKLQTLALLELKPRDLETGIPMPPGELFDRRAGGAEAPMATVVTSRATPELLQSVANRIVHPFGGVKRLLLANADAGVLVSHAIGAVARDALQRGDNAAFLRLRSADLARHFRDFFGRQARWTESDRPSIASLAVAEES